LLQLPWTLDEIKAERGRRHFRAYIALAWAIVEPATPFVANWHIDAIADHLQAVTDGAIANLLITIPPRCMKSLTVSVFWPTWAWIDDPAARWLFASYALQLAVRDSVKCRRIIQSDWYQQHWGARYQLTSDVNQKMRFENDHAGFRLATGVGGAATGEGGKYVVVDDALKAEDAHSDVRREAANQWWDTTMTTRANDPTSPRRVIVGQRLHEDDLPGHVLAKAQAGGAQWVHLNLPMRYEPQIYVGPLDWHDPRTGEGELLDPARFPEAAVAEWEIGLGEDAPGQLQQRPTPPGGAVFKAEWWDAPERRYDPDGLLLPDAPRVMGRWLFFDTAFKDQEQHDNTACSVVELLADYRLRWREVWQGKVEFPRLLHAIEALAIAWNTDDKLVEVVIEDKGAGTSALQTLRAAAPAWLRGKLAAFLPQSSKELRAKQAAYWCARGAILLPRPAASVPWLFAFEQSLAKFPRAAHDDDVDTLSMGVLYLEQRYLLRWAQGQSLVGQVA
jgi:predicted phage terminase large subunit-like protein